jgi:predicted DCC family thiol-disulfide oxidoreductase YuxK
VTSSMQSNQPIIVFDGKCVLCNRWVHFIIKHDARHLFKFAAMQSEPGQQLLRRYGLNPIDPSSLLLIDETGAHTDTQAIIQVISRFGGIWRLMVLLRLIPRLLRDPTYRWFARNRYRWFGQHEPCMVPSPDVVERFIQ